MPKNSSTRTSLAFTAMSQECRKLLHDNEITISDMSAFRRGRARPAREMMGRILRILHAERPDDHHRLLTAYVLDSCPHELTERFAKILADMRPLESEPVGPVDLEIGLANLRTAAGEEAAIRQAIILLARNL